MKILLPTVCALLIFAFAPVSFATEAKKKSWWKISCTPLNVLDSKIVYCMDNKWAVESAESCHKELMQAWASASVDLQNVKTLSHAAGQQGEFGNSDSKYNSTIDRLAYLTRATRRSSDLISQYPSVMEDMAGTESVQDSLPCYQEAFRKIQKIVSDLDKKSIEGLMALEETDALLEMVEDNTDSIESTSTLVKSAKGGKSGQGAPAGFQRKNWRQPASDITGIRPKPGQVPVQKDK